MTPSSYDLRLEVWDGTVTATEVYEGVPGASRGGVLDQELTIPEAARRLTMSEKTLANWVFRARQGRLAGLGDALRPVTDLEAEVSRLKRELAEARMERDILKNPRQIQPRTLRRRSCPVRTHGDATPPSFPWPCGVGYWRCPEAATMSGSTGVPRNAPRRMRGQ